MNEPRSYEASDGPTPMQEPEDARWDERPSPVGEFRSYSLELLAVLEE